MTDAREQQIAELIAQVEALRVHDRCVDAVQTLANGRSFYVDRSLSRHARSGPGESWTLTVYIRSANAVWAQAYGPTAAQALDDLRARLAETPEPTPKPEESDSLYAF